MDSTWRKSHQTWSYKWNAHGALYLGRKLAEKMGGGTKGGGRGLDDSSTLAIQIKPEKYRSHWQRGNAYLTQSGIHKTWIPLLSVAQSSYLCWAHRDFTSLRSRAQSNWFEFQLHTTYLQPKPFSPTSALGDVQSRRDFFLCINRHDTFTGRLSSDREDTLGRGWNLSVLAG